MNNHIYLAWSDFLETIDARFAGTLLCPHVCRAGLEEESYKKIAAYEVIYFISMYSVG